MHSNAFKCVLSLPVKDARFCIVFKYQALYTLYIQTVLAKWQLSISIPYWPIWFVGLLHAKYNAIRPKKVSCFWSSVGFKIGTVMHIFFRPFFYFYFFCQQGNIHGDQISHTQSMVAKRGLTNRANVHTPMWKSHLNTARQNSNRSSNYGCNWTSSHSNKKIEEKKCWHVGPRRHAWRPETGDFFFALSLTSLISMYLFCPCLIIQTCQLFGSFLGFLPEGFFVGMPITMLTNYRNQHNVS